MAVPRAHLCRYVISKGLEHRHRRVHQLNSDSSRSHSIFSVYVDATDDADDASTADGASSVGGTGAQRYGRISLLDLAGSENVRTSQSHGAGLKEAGSINKSLFALGQVIKALSSAGGARLHVPYRDSNLTKLLSDSLGGSALTLMVACCSPFLAYAEESMRTLHYACSAGAIRNRPVIKLDPQEQLIAQLRDEVQKLKAQVVHLRLELNISNTRLAEHGLPASPTLRAPNDPDVTDVSVSSITTGQPPPGAHGLSYGGHSYAPPGYACAAVDLSAALSTAATSSASRPPASPRFRRGGPNLGDLTSASQEYEHYRSLISQRLLNFWKRREGCPVSCEAREGVLRQNFLPGLEGREFARRL